jgi:hypothetical protein
MIGYIPTSRLEAHCQLHSARRLVVSWAHGLMGALLCETHPLIAAYARFLRKYDHIVTRFARDIDQAHGRRLGPSLVIFHVQLAWRNWLVTQLDSGEMSHLAPPYFCQGLTLMEVRNNFP